MELPIFRKVKASALSTFSFFLFTLTGCNSYQITQTNTFANDDGMIVRVDYGQAKKDHVNTFVSPANGRKLDFKSKLVVEVTLPDWPDDANYPGKKEGEKPPFDGESFTAWQCMNFGGNGTMYKTDDDEWYFLASGFTCKVARKDGRFGSGYRDVFGGVLCNTPVEAPKKDGRWRKVKATEKKYE